MVFTLKPTKAETFPPLKTGWGISPHYMAGKRLTDLIDHIDDPRQPILRAIYNEHATLFQQNPGSRNNHQAWPGGLADHVANGLRTMWELYPWVQAKFEAYGEKVPFSLGSAQVVWFFHDTDKLVRYAPPGHPFAKRFGALMKTANVHAIGHAVLSHWYQAYGLTFTPQEENALNFVHGESDARYNNEGRRMNELASFVHATDNLDARLFHALGRGRG